MRIRRSILLPSPPARTWHALQSPRLFLYVTWPFVRFQPLSPPRFPATWAAGRYHVRMYLFGWIPLGTQWLVPTVRPVDSTAEPPVYELVDEGENALLTRFTHRITLTPAAGDRTWYTDEVEIEAKRMTPLFWLGAAVLFRYRQRRLRQLARQDFRYRG